jgi:predicted glycogen debranching enzyme
MSDQSSRSGNGRDTPTAAGIGGLTCGSGPLLDVGREICGGLGTAEPREWLCANGIGGFASGTVAGLSTRRYHGLLVAALTPPVGRTLLVTKLDETVEYAGATWDLYANRWADGTLGPHGYRLIERFHLDGTTPVWTFACADAQLDKRVWMEPGANTTYVRYALVRGSASATLAFKAMVNYRNFHSATHAGGWRMAVASVPHGLSVTAYEGARPFVILAEGAAVEPAHEWYLGYGLAREADRGLDAADDNLHVGTFRITLEPGAAVTVALSAENTPSLDGEAAWARRVAHESEVLARWRTAHPAPVPGFVDRLALAADQFVVRRPLADDPDAMSVIAGYHWFGDWGRDTMISLPGLCLTTGRADVASRILTTFARFVDQGMLPNVFPDSGEKPEYNTADAALWYVEAVRAYHAATDDADLIRGLFPALADMIGWHERGTRYGIGMDAADGLLRAGEPGVQVTWMDAKVGDRVVTPRTGKPVEINALWYNALRAMSTLARVAGQDETTWNQMAERAAAGFDRFWNEAAGACFDVIDGPAGADATLRPNQIFAVSLAASPLSPERQRRVVETCARHLLTSFGLRSLGPGEPAYTGRYGGGPAERDGAYHQGPAWGWLLGPFALAHLRVHGDRETARAFLAPMAHHLTEYGLGSIAEIFEGDAPFAPRGAIAQAWSVAETLRAWCEIDGSGATQPAGGTTPATRAKTSTARATTPTPRAKTPTARAARTRP